MKIAIIAHSLHPVSESFTGGSEMITYLLVQELVRQEYSVDLYARKDSCQSLPLRPMLTEVEVLNKFSEQEIALSEMSKYEFVQTVIYHDVMARVMEQRYDIVHNHSLHHVPILLGNHLGRKFITSLHNLAANRMKLGFRTLPLILQTVTTVSNHQRQHFKGMVQINRTIHNGIDLDHWHPNYQLKENYFFWMGGMCAEEAPHHAILACLRANQRLLLAGSVSDNAYLEEFVVPHLHHNNISYLGHLTHAELVSKLKNANALLFTSTCEEPYDFTMAESLACGTPVVAYRVGAAPEIVSADAGILVDKGDVNGLADALQSVRTIDRFACRRRAESFCAAAAMIDKYLTLYREVSIYDR